MNEKNFPDDNNTLSLEELTNEANNIIEMLENEKNLENSIEKYQRLIKLNNIIEKRFSKSSKKISEETRKKIQNIANKKNAK
tara:strand:- start:1533 stop:1778 length:246 start_codon:yes stop_codon:yes gene_type:complete